MALILFLCTYVYTDTYTHEDIRFCLLVFFVRLFLCLFMLKYTFPPLSPWMTTATLVAQGSSLL